jgi:hypothetical protein
VDKIQDLERRIEALEQERLRAGTAIVSSRLYTVFEACQILQCGKSNVYDLLNNQMIARIDVGVGKSGVRILGRDLLAFIESRRSGGPQSTITFKHLRGEFGQSG